MNHSQFIQLTASAGSGKTYALTTRFLRLMAQADPSGLSGGACRATRENTAGYAWPEILAITFTNQAATEMRGRLVSALKKRALEQDGNGMATALSPKAAHTNLAAILQHAHLLNIRTIDSLLSRIVMAFALELRLPPTVSTVFEPKELFEPLYDDLLAGAEAGNPEADLLDKAVESLLKLEKVEGFWLAGKLRDRMQTVFTWLLTNGDAQVMDNEQDLKNLLTSSTAALHQASRDMLAGLETCGANGNSHFLKALDKCLALDIFGEPVTSTMLDKRGLAECVLKKTQPRITDAAEACYQALREISAQDRRMRAACQGALKLVPFVRLGRELYTRMQADERNQGVLAAAGWPSKVRTLLSGGGADQVFCRLGTSIRHMLLDEFQDTSREQWMALLPLAEECLATGGSVFYVGDVKQAIYGWRGGDARLFAEAARGGLADLADVDRQRLPCNWRSRKQVVDFVNRVFGPLSEPGSAAMLARVLLPDDAPQDVVDGLTEGVAASFRDCTQDLPPDVDREGGRAAVYHIEAANQDELLQATLHGLDGLLAELADQGRNLREVAVLVRTGNQAQAVAGHLAEQGVPAVTEQSLLVAEHPLVRQLLALLRFLDTGDDLAFWTFVHGREVFAGAAGLNDGQLHQWLAGLSKTSRPLHVEFADAFPQAFELIRPFLEKAGLMRPYDLTARALDIFKPLERRPEAAIFARRFLEIVHSAEEQGLHTLGAFLERFDERGDQERLPAPEDLDAVTVMTIHKAKGLEFPVVAVPFHHWKPRTTGELTGIPLNRDTLLTPLAKDLGAPYYAKLAKEQLEHAHLLYVAWTRAVEELHVFVPANGFTGTVASGVRGLLEGFDAYVRPCPQPANQQQAAEKTPPAVRPVATPQAAPLNSWLPRLKVSLAFKPKPRQVFDEADRGTLVHAVLERLRLGGSADDAAAIERALDFALAGLRVPPDVKDDLRHQVRGCVEFVLGHELLRRCLTHGQAESGLLDANGAMLRPDLLAELDLDGRAMAVIVDYKTGHPDAETNAGYQRQVRRYMRAASAALGKPAAGFLAYVDEKTVQRVET